MLIGYYLLCFSFLVLIELSYCYDHFSKSLIFNMDCNKGIADRSIMNKFITSNGVTLGKNRNNENDMACSFEEAFLKTTASYLTTFPITFNFWFKKVSNSNFNLFSFTNNNKGFSIAYNSFLGKLQLKDKATYTSVFETTLESSNVYWNQLTLSISNSPSTLVFALNETTFKVAHSFSVITNDYTLYIGSDNGFDKMSGVVVDNFKIYKMYFDDKSSELSQLILNNHCEDTQAYIDKKCIKCSSLPNCLNCVNTTHCTVCNPGFSLTNETNCTCQRESCVECSYDGSCYKCEDGYQLNDNKNCVLNNCTHLDYCTKCLNNTCLECIGNYLISNDKCELPSNAIIGVVVTFLFVVIVIWVVILALVRPKLIT